MNRRLIQALPYLATAIVGGLLVVVSLNVFNLGSNVDANRAAIKRSCEVLNAAIVESQRSQGGEPSRILIEAILDGKPEVRGRFERASKRAGPALKTIDCDRVAEDPSYRPYGRM